MKTSSPRTIAFVGLMGALGNVMFVISGTIFNVGPIAVDFSHIGTLIAAIYGGPWVGLATGLIVGIGPGMYFGYPVGSLGLLGLIGLPVGKAMTGVTVGYLVRVFKIDSTKHSSWKVLAITLTGYIPEAVFTVVFFESLVTILIPSVAVFFMNEGSMVPFVITVLTKAWIEMTVLAVFMGALVGNRGFSEFVNRVFARPYVSKVSSKPSE